MAAIERRDEKKGLIPVIVQFDWADLRPHPEADVFPMADDHALASLKESIKAHGIKAQEPIIVTRINVPGGGFQIADGRNRYRAAMAVGHKLSIGDFQEFTGTFDELVQFVAERNTRRHMTNEDKKAYAKKLIEKYPAWPSRKLAVLAGVSHTTIAELRRPPEEDKTYKALVGAWSKATIEAQEKFVEENKIDIQAMLSVK